MALQQAKSRRGLSVISLFTGAGGLDLGFEAAGFRTVACVELDADARATIAANRPAWNLLDEGDIFNTTAAKIMRAAGTSRRAVDVVIGGPPCQPFSKSAYWASGSTARLKDPRADTLSAMMDIVERALPRAVVIENVRGITYRKKDEGLRLVKRRLREINRAHKTRYRACVVHLNATDFGVPQVRERAFVVAFRDGQRFVAPAATHGDCSEDATTSLLPVATVWDALGNMVPGKRELKKLRLKGKWADLLPSVPEGQNYLWHTARGGGLPIFGWRTRYWSFLLKLEKVKPSWTLQASPGPATGPFHWDNRLLSVREMCRLQTFPTSYKIVGNYASARRQIGNAVPPALAEAVARRLRSVLLDETYESTISLAIGQRKARPKPARSRQVPQKYRALVGQYDDHPGTGKGPGAARREQSKQSLELGSTAVSNERRQDRHSVPLNIRDQQWAAA